jgi:predicted O-methyltransferase YrrM
MQMGTLEKARLKLSSASEAATVDVQGNIGYRFSGQDYMGENVEAEFAPFLLMRDHGKGPYEIDFMFPLEMKGPMTVWGIDEGGAHMLTGIVRALKPLVCLETGTNKGRSARAIVEGLEYNEQGVLYTVDMFDHHIFDRGAIPENLQGYVKVVIGDLPNSFKLEPLCDLEGIDFAFLDAGHERDELVADLEFIETHRAKECLVLVDNARDTSWPEIAEYFNTYTDHPHLNLDTMCGMELIQMRG